MQVQIPKNLLNLATIRAQGAISDRALAQIGLNAKDQQLQVAATDRVLAVYSRLECEVKEAGTVFVPGKLFSDVIRELPDGLVTLVTEESFLRITGGADAKFTMKIPLISDIQWREPPTFQSKNVADIPTSQLTYMVEQVQMCIQQESPRNYGSVGFLHRPEKNKLRLVGTDGFRLSYCDINSELPENFLPEGVCLSKRALVELLRMCGEGFEKIHLAVSEDNSTILVTSGNYWIFSRLSAVKYPKYQGVLPSANLNPVRLGRSLLQSVTKRVLLAADKTNALQLSFCDRSLTLSSKTAGSSESREALELEDYRGSKTELSVNGKFLTDVFSTVASNELTLQFKSEEDPIVIIPRDEPAECRSMHVLVPIRENV